jgi:hypothetical protein
LTPAFIHPPPALTFKVVAHVNDFATGFEFVMCPGNTIVQKVKIFFGGRKRMGRKCGKCGVNPSGHGEISEIKSQPWEKQAASYVMGTEYRISCPPDGLPKMQAFLRRVGGQPCRQFPEQLEFRFQPSQPDGMPDATAVIESAGIYFCVHCGASEPVAVLFRRIIDEALTLSDSSDSLVITTL